MRTVPLMLLASLAGCAGMSERANDALDRLDVPVAGVVEALAEAPKIAFVIDMADIDNNGRIDAAEEWFALLSGLVAAIEGS